MSALREELQFHVMREYSGRMGERKNGRKGLHVKTEFYPFAFRLSPSDREGVKNWVLRICPRQRPVDAL